MNDNNSLQTNDYYKNLDKHNNCSKCDIILTRDNYKKGRTVCKLCYNNNVLRYYKNKFCSNLTPKSDVGTQTDWNNLINQDITNNKSTSNDCVNSNKKILSKKQSTPTKKVRSTKKDDLINHDSSNIEDITINNIYDNDPNRLCDKLREILSKSDMIESDYTMTKMILDELLRSKCISKKQYNGISKNIGLL